MNPSEHPNVMVSSTWSDLAEHRKEAIDALHRLGFFAIGMEFTELEYRRAVERGIPVYMFLMSDKHPVFVDGVEKVEAYAANLRALKQDARKRSICAEFSSVLELKTHILQSCRLP